jgi:phosphotransferase system  glucose/maltose/N-acetylglucosamine-specific IIC component
MEFNWLLAVGLFFASLVLDAIFALYTVAVINTQAIRAASLSLVTYLLYAVGVLNFVDNKWYIVPLSLGAFAGSYMVVKYEAIKKKRSKKRDKKH